MSRRRSNMLEAFQATASNQETADRTPVRDLFSKSPLGGGMGKGAGSGAGFRVPLAISFLGTLALGFLLGRLSAPGSTVIAGEDAGLATGVGEDLAWLTEREAGSEGQAREGQGSSADSAAVAVNTREGVAAPADPVLPTGSPSPGDAAMFDLANRVTLRVIYYSQDEKERVWETHNYLVQRGLPVGRPVDVGRIIVLLVGAAPGAAGLAELKTRLRAMEGPNHEAGAFKGAYVVNIDSDVER